MAIPIYNENDVTLVINNLNNPGWDNIPALIAKQVIHCYIRPLVFFYESVSSLRVYFQMN